MTTRPDRWVEVSFGESVGPDWVKECLIEQWGHCTLTGLEQVGEVNVRICDEEEMSAVHRQFADKDYPTNVLSFPTEIDPAVGVVLLGDVLICAQVVDREAIAQNKTRRQHCAHMLVHGVLHLLGFDHQTDAEAQMMEAQECRLLKTLGFPDPYQDSET